MFVLLGVITTGGGGGGAQASVRQADEICQMALYSKTPIIQQLQQFDSASGRFSALLDVTSIKTLTHFQYFKKILHCCIISCERGECKGSTGNKGKMVNGGPVSQMLYHGDIQAIG